jgi:cell division protein FtsI (penicillin-binding protein 3)
MKDIKKDIVWRITLTYVLVLLFGFVVIGRIVYIQFFEGEKWRKKAKEETLKYINIDAIRGDICSSDGSLLASSIPIYEIRLDLGSKSITKDVFNKSVDSLAYCLAELFKDKSKSEYKEELVTARKIKERYYLLKRNISYACLKQMKSFPLLKLGRYGGGFIVIPKTSREMPFKNLAARTIGFEREDYFVGLEGAYTTTLSGITGKRLMQKIAGDIWMPVTDENEIEPKNGSDVYTTIDINIQDVAENALKKQLLKSEADHGCAILMEVETGEIKAIVNLTKNSKGDYNETYNYAIGESLEPGSTFKLVSVIAALEDNLTDINDIVETGNGFYQWGDIPMYDSHVIGNGFNTVKTCFEQSSNIGISKIIYKCYSKNPQKFIDRMCSMGLNKPLGIEINGEGKPDIKNTKSKNWSSVSLPFMSIGYEVRLTPLQILTFYNAVANNGKMMKPMFVKTLRSLGKIVKTYEPVVLNPKICSKKTIEKVTKLLIGVVENGTAKNINNAVYQIAGKTGTAKEIFKKNAENNEKAKYRASFVGFFPAHNPKYSCIVVINNPNGEYYGSAVAAPVFKEIADKVYATRLEMPNQITDTSKLSPAPVIKYGYMKDLVKIYKTLNYKTKSIDNVEWVNCSQSNTIVKLEKKIFNPNLIPDVTGIGAKDAVFLLEKTGMKVNVVGKGKVISQSVTPGTKVIKGNEITLILSRKEI